MTLYLFMIDSLSFLLSLLREGRVANVGSWEWLMLKAEVREGEDSGKLRAYVA